MNRTLIIIRIVIWSAIALALIGLLVSGVLGNRFGGFSFEFNFGDGGNMKTVYEETVPVAGISDLTLDLKSMNVVFTASDSAEIRIVHEAAGDIDKDQYVKVEKTATSVTVKQPMPKGIWFFRTVVPQRLTVYLPTSYANALNINNTSGNLKIEPALYLSAFALRLTSGNFSCDAPLTAKDIIICMTSGDVNVNALSCDTYNIISTSGNVRGGSLSGKGSLRMTSGDVGFDSVTGVQHEIETTSGNIRINSISGKASLRDTSGNISATLKGPSADFTAHTSSGNIDVTLPKDASARIQASCSSGNIRGDVGFSYDEKGKHASATVGSGSATIDLSATSGNINVNTLQ